MSENFTALPVLGNYYALCSDTGHGHQPPIKGRLEYRHPLKLHVGKPASPLFEFARVLVRLDDIARIVNVESLKEPLIGSRVCIPRAGN